VELEIDREAGIAGVVRDASGAPRAGARVEAVCLTEPADRASVTSGADGRYVLPLSGDCRYAIEVQGAPRGVDGWPQVTVGRSYVTGVDL
jgi:hypothetical protein